MLSCEQVKVKVVDSGALQAVNVRNDLILEVQVESICEFGWMFFMQTWLVREPF